MLAENSSALRLRPGRGVLVVNPQGLGDVIGNLPLLQAVCAWAAGRFPVWVLFQSPAHYSLLSEEGLALTPLFVHPDYTGFGGLFRLWRELLRQVDLVVTVPEVSPAKQALLKLMLRAAYAAGEASPPYSRMLSHPIPASWARPLLDSQADILSAIGIPGSLQPPMLHLSPVERDWAEAELSRSPLARNWPLIGIHCTSLSSSKAWPLSTWGELLRGLSRLHPDLGVISFGIPDERPTSEQLRAQIPHVAWLEATGLWTLRQSLAMLTRCHLFISGDTGLMHMAAAVGARTVSIFGPTAATRRAPVSNGGVAIVPETPCYPCFRGDSTPCNCIQTIASERVLRAAAQCLQDVTGTAALAPAAHH